MLDRKKYMRRWRIKHKNEIKEYAKEYYNEHKKEILKKGKQFRKNNPKCFIRYRQEHKEELREYNRQWYLNNMEKVKIASKQWRKNNPERLKETNGKWKKNNIKKWIRYTKQYQENNSEKIKENHRIRRTDLKYNLNHKISGAIYKSIRGNKKGRQWEGLVGYTLDKLKKHLKKTMPQGYTWQDFLESKLHIDHIIPISAHNFNQIGQVDFQKCWALSNLQLLPAKENLKKYNRLERPFQISLPI